MIEEPVQVSTSYRKLQFAVANHLERKGGIEDEQLPLRALVGTLIRAHCAIGTSHRILVELAITGGALRKPLLPALATIKIGPTAIMSSLQDPLAARMIALKSNTDARGVLVAVENGADLPFVINRFFLVIGMNEAPRGFHAHRILHELVICARGSCRIVTDNGTTRREWVLDRPDAGLHLPPLHWIELSDFSSDCVLTVLASDAYDDAEYIRDYSVFVAATGNAASS